MATAVEQTSVSLTFCVLFETQSAGGGLHFLRPLVEAARPEPTPASDSHLSLTFFRFAR